MGVEVNFTTPHRPRLPRRPSLAGTGLAERMRSTAFALLGLTAAAGLALVAIFSQVGWSDLATGPVAEPRPAGIGTGSALERPLALRAEEGHGGSLRGGTGVGADGQPEPGETRVADHGEGVAGGAPLPVPDGHPELGGDSAGNA